MSHPEADPFKVNELDYRRLDKFMDGLQLEVSNPTNGDERIGAFARATYEQLLYRGEILQTLAEVFAWHRYMGDRFPPAYARRFLLRAVQKQALERQEDASLPYPERFNSPEAWHYLYNDNIDYPELGQDMSLYKVQSNVSERYKSVALIVRAYSDRLGPNPRVLDVGCSMNIGLKKLTVLKAYPFGETDLVDQCAHNTWMLSQDRNSNEILANTLSTPVEIGQSIGIDMYPPHPNSKKARLWIKSHSFYPSELLTDTVRVKEFDDLAQLEVPSVETYRGNIDIADEEQVDLLMSSHPGWQPDLVVASTTLHQFGSTKRARALANISKLSNADTVIVVNDFVQTDPTAKGGLSFVNQERWVDPFTYRTLVKDLATGEPWQEHYHWSNGRCHQIQLTNIGRTALGL